MYSDILFKIQTFLWCAKYGYDLDAMGKKMKNKNNKKNEIKMTKLS